MGQLCYDLHILLGTRGVGQNWLFAGPLNVFRHFIHLGRSFISNSHISALAYPFLYLEGLFHSGVYSSCYFAMAFFGLQWVPQLENDVRASEADAVQMAGTPVLSILLPTYIIIACGRYRVYNSWERTGRSDAKVYTIDSKVQFWVLRDDR